MSKSRSLEQKITSRQRDIWIVTSVVILAMGAGVAVMWPSVKAAIVEKFGDQFPTKILLADFLFLVTFLIVYVWHSGSQLKRLVRRLVLEKGQNAGLEVQLDTLRSILEASSQHDQSSAEYLNSLLQLVTESLRADQCVLYRARHDGILERDASFPSMTQAPEPDLMQFEDEVALGVMRSGQTTLIWEDADPAELGLHTPRPEQGLDTLAGTPLFLEDDEIGGVLLIRNPGGLLSAELDDEGLQYFQIFAGFAAGVVRNLRAFQEIAQSKADLDRAHENLMEQQRELSEVETVTALSRIAYTMAHGMSSPLTAMSGYADLLKESDPGSPESRMAHKGMSSEIVKLRDRMQSAIDFTSSYRSRYELIDMNDMVEHCLSNCQAELDAESVAVTLEAYDDLPLTMVDVVRMRQVLLTLLKYVKKTLSNAPPPRKLKVRTLPFSGKVRVQFLFPGWSNVVEAVEPLLKTNVEMDSMQKNQEGLSVAIASTIVRHHQGEVSVDLDGQMVLVTVEVPIRRDAPPPPKGVIAVGNSGEPQRVEEVLDQILSFGEPEPQIAQVQGQGDAETEVPVASDSLELADPFAAMAMEPDTLEDLQIVEPLPAPDAALLEPEPDPEPPIKMPEEVPDSLRNLGTEPVVHAAPPKPELAEEEPEPLVSLFGPGAEEVPTIGDTGPAPAAPAPAPNPPAAKAPPRKPASKAAAPRPAAKAPTPKPAAPAPAPRAEAPPPAAAPRPRGATSASKPLQPSKAPRQTRPQATSSRGGLPPMQASQARSQMQMAPSPKNPAAAAPPRPAAEESPSKPAPGKGQKDKATLDNIFRPGDIYRPQGPVSQPVAKPAAKPLNNIPTPPGTSGTPTSAAQPGAKPASEPTTAPLLDGGEIEDALKLFDDADG